MGGQEFRHLCRLPLLVLLCGAAGCTGPAPRSENSLAQAAGTGFTREVLQAGGFDLLTLRRTRPGAGDILTIYIEGDGLAWWRRTRPAADPTPKHALGLALALKDPDANVLYLARPCQFQPRPLPETCRPALWTSERYGEAVIAAMNEAINQVAKDFERVALVGYSGGGSVAALIAARRDDVAWMITIGANLDHARWTDLHHVTALTGSLNAADFAGAVQRIPQVHYLGGRDDIVPTPVVESYMAGMTDHSQASIRIEAEFDHECCWVEAWPRLLHEAYK